MVATKRAPSGPAAPGSNGSYGDADRASHRVGEIQRARMLAAMAQVAGEYGAANVTVAHVVARAGVSRRTFYEIFSDCQACLLAAFEDGVAKAALRVVLRYRASGVWRKRMRASLETFLEFLEEEPSLGRLLVVESLGSGEQVLRRRQQVLAAVIAAVDAGGRESRTGGDLPPLLGDGLVGGALAVIYGRMLERDSRPSDDRGGRLMELLNPLMSMIVLPYMGPAAARRELNRAAAARPAQSSADTRSLNPLKDLDIRLTYRTIRTLAAVAAHPNSSNRVIADAAGITDQGQVSKLLARLQRLGLIHNIGTGAATRGERNAWTLTPTGDEVHRAIADHVVSA